MGYLVRNTVARRTSAREGGLPRKEETGGCEREQKVAEEQEDGGSGTGERPSTDKKRGM